MRHLALALALLTAVPAYASEPLPPLIDAATAERLRSREAEILERVREFDPRRHEELLALRESEPRAYMGALWRIARVAEQRQRGPVTPEIQAEVAKIEAIKADHPDGLDGLSHKEQAAVRAEIAVIAERLFDLRQAERRRKLEHLHDAIAELEADVARRDDERATLIDEFVDMVMRGRVDL